MGVSDNSRGLILAMLSSLFIGTSFILKKKGLHRAAGGGGTRAGIGGYTYLLEPLWWAGMITMIVGEVANFVAYIYAPAVLVTPLGALSIIVRERLRKMGILGCVSCIVGSVVIVIHAPQEHTPSSVQEVWDLASQPAIPCSGIRSNFLSGLLVADFREALDVGSGSGELSWILNDYSPPSTFSGSEDLLAFLIYVAATLSLVLVLMLHLDPLYGQTNILVYLGICSLMGALTVVSIKAIGIAMKLTLEGMNQFGYAQTWFFLSVAVICVFTQLNYLNKALDTFSAAIVSPIYYVMFTTLTIIASAIMFKDWSGQNVSSITSEICGFIIVLSGTVILHMTREEEPTAATGDRYLV
ncbi:hypothetical protein OROMI_033100 [Orobanche minor]